MYVCKCTSIIMHVVVVHGYSHVALCGSLTYM